MNATAPTLRALELETQRLRADVAELVEALERFTSIMAHCSVTDGTCCCGDDMDKHASPMFCGHSPVDHGQYHADLAYEAAKDILAKHGAQP
jgi:hypothetical protein